MAGTVLLLPKDAQVTRSQRTQIVHCYGNYTARANCPPTKYPPTSITLFHWPRPGPAHDAGPTREPRSTDVMRSRLALVLTSLLVLSAAWPVPSAASLRTPSWSWPLSPRPAVVRAFAKPVQKWKAGHRGIDLDCAKAQEIRAPAPGTVSHSGRVVDRGVITITTEDGFRTSFEPVVDQLPRGTHVTAGTVIARRDPELKHEGCASCLHWGVREGEEYINPLSLVGALRPSVLLPRSRDPAPGGRAWSGSVAPARPTL